MVALGTEVVFDHELKGCADLARNHGDLDPARQAAYVHGTGKWRSSPRLRSVALVLLGGFAITASLANIVEDVRWLTWSQNSKNYTAAEIAVMVQLKFILVSLNLAAWAFLAYRHWPAFHARWLKKKEHT